MLDRELRTLTLALEAMQLEVIYFKRIMTGELCCSLRLHEGKTICAVLRGNLSIYFKMFRMSACKMKVGFCTVRSAEEPIVQH